MTTTLKTNLPTTPFAKPKSQSFKRQSGVSFFGFLILAAFAIAIVLLGMKIFPTVLEYNAIVRAVKKSAQEGGETPAEIRKKFESYSAIDDFTAIKGSDLDITKVNGKIVVAFKYERRIGLMGPASLVLDYEGSSQSN